MVYLQYLLVVTMAVIIRPGCGYQLDYDPHPPPVAKGECPVKPAGISGFRPAVGTRLYYAWSTVQGTAKAQFLSNAVCRGGRTQDCSCIGYDVTGYNISNAELQEGFVFSVNKKLKVGTLNHFIRKWTHSGDYHLKCLYDTVFQYGDESKSGLLDSYKQRFPPVSSYHDYHGVWNQHPTSRNVNLFSKSLKVLSWTSKEVVVYNCASVDPDIRIFTSYIPSKSSEIPYSVFDILTQLGININTLRWIKLDHKNCVYPNKSTYPRILASLNPSTGAYNY